MPHRHINRAFVINRIRYQRHARRVVALDASVIRDQALFAFEEVLMGEEIRGVEVEGQGCRDEGRIPDVDEAGSADIDAIDILQDEIQVTQVHRAEYVSRTSPSHEKCKA
ncbi:MAG: hypothetical protein BWY49_00085 [Candidatus Omnitrophica bacterium ADurb.Bin314]|nr:MAG: hypothetical protein BWY49_00085 [Candidatus Omnitrophica bacterium ADurb.Bin314]